MFSLVSWKQATKTKGESSILVICWREFCIPFQLNCDENGVVGGRKDGGLVEVGAEDKVVIRGVDVGIIYI